METECENNGDDDRGITRENMYLYIVEEHNPAKCNFCID